MSVDYLKTEDFARRPLAWLDLISRNPGTTLSYSPTFGYDICARRMSSQTHVAERFDLSRWRIAGNGADMIRPDVMQAFVDAFADAGFKARRFLPELRPRRSDAGGHDDAAGRRHPRRAGRGERLSGGGTPATATGRAATARSSIAASRCATWRSRSAATTASTLADREIGKVWCRGAERHARLFPRRGSDRAPACVDGWLDTGDMGYMSDGYLFIVGRAKDMIIINGKNHWPQDIEWAVEQLPGFKSGDIAAFAITGPRRGNARGAGPLPHLRPRGTRPPARPDPRAGPRDHRHHASSSWSRRARCRAPARASCRAPRRAISTSPARSSLTR